MSKALEALKKIKQDGNYCDDCGGIDYCNNYNTNKICGMKIEIDEAISEIEAQEAKSCKDCTWWKESEEDDISNPRWCSKGISEGYTTSITDEDFYCNKHGIKATK